MEDFFSVAYQQSQDGDDLEFAFIGIFDGKMTPNKQTNYSVFGPRIVL